MLNTDPAVPLSGIHHRLSPQILAEQLKSENEYHINNWLEARGKLPRHRTISKARRAALAGCYRLLDPEQQGSVQRADVQRILRALGFQPATVSKVLANANADEDGLSPGEFTRLCVEAEQAAVLVLPTTGTSAPATTEGAWRTRRRFLARKQRTARRLAEEKKRQRLREQQRQTQQLAGAA